MHRMYLIASPVHRHSPPPTSPVPCSAQHKQSKYTHTIIYTKEKPICNPILFSL